MNAPNGTSLNERRSGRSRLLDYAHELLFAANVALAAALYADLSIPLLVGIINRRVITPLLRPPQGLKDWDTGEYLAIWLLALALTVCILLLLRLISETFVARAILRWIAAVVAIGTLPAATLYLAYLEPLRPASAIPHFWLFAELIVALGCALAYLRGNWPVPRWGSLVLVILHFGFWGWLLLGGPYFWRGRLIWLAFPCAGLGSVLVWSRYVAREPALRAARVVDPSPDLKSRE